MRERRIENSRTLPEQSCRARQDMIDTIHCKKELAHAAIFSGYSSCFCDKKYSSNDKVEPNSDIFGELGVVGDDFHELIE